MQTRLCWVSGAKYGRRAKCVKGCRDFRYTGREGEMMGKNIYAAHIAEDENIHSLEDHLCKVGSRAETYASVFESGDWDNSINFKVEEYFDE